MDRPLYLDYNSTTPVDPRVVDSMIPYLFERFGNPSSAHLYGYDAHAALERARAQVAALIGALPDEIVFTGGGSEADNLAVKGAAFANIRNHPHIVSSTVEHSAVLSTLQYLKARFGVDYTLVPVDEYGTVRIDEVREALRPETVLVTIMHANNEVGTIQPLREIAEIAHEMGVLFHTDASQSLGKVSVDVHAIGVDLLTIAGHKLYAPKGLGALYVRRGVQIDSLVHGSAQEHGLRAGTEHVAGAVALGTAADLAAADQEAEAAKMCELRQLLHRELLQAIPDLRLNGHPDSRLPNTLNVGFPGTLGQIVLAFATEVAASTGSACHSAAAEPSHVLLAMGMSPEEALSAVRLSLGRWSTKAEVVQAARCLASAYDLAIQQTA